MEKPDTTSRSIEILHRQVRTYLKEGLTPEQIIVKLKNENLQPYYIETIISNIEDEDDDKKSLRNSIIMGGFFIIGGLILNILSWRASENLGSSSFILFWGIVVTGIVTVVRGLILYRR